jgi:dTDP-4-amino-4,6-dideoxygalactose transaminase
MIDFIEKKDVCWKRLQTLIKKSSDSNHWTNFGPLSLQLEMLIHELLKLPNNLKVVSTSSGTTALYALTSLHSFLKGRQLKWAVSSFSFSCVSQNILHNSEIFDCDDKGIFGLESFKSSKNSDIDGIIVTNTFGTLQCIQKFVDYCKEKNIILIVDSALNFNSCNHIANDFISFHQTKPWGMGEGGCLIVEEQHENVVRKIINFGSMLDNTHSVSFNGKMSDVSAAFIIDRLTNISDIEKTYKEQYARIKNLALQQGLNLLGENLGIPAHIPILSNQPIYKLENDIVKLQKYYRPLKETAHAKNIYAKIINFPCHKDLQNLTDENILRCLRKLL